MSGFYQLFLESVERWPQNVAVEVQREASLESHTYAELRRMAESMGRWLAESGVARGARCALLGENGARWVAAYLGTLAAGDVAVPLDTAFHADQVAKLLRDCDASILFVDAKHLGVGRRATEGLPTRLALLDAAPEKGDLPHLDAIFATGPGSFTPAAAANGSMRLAICASAWKSGSTPRRASVGPTSR